MAVANRPIDYPSSNFLLAQLSRGSTSGVRVVNGVLQAITPAEGIAAQNQFSLFAQIKHFFGYGEMGYLSMRRQIQQMARDDAKNLMRTHCASLFAPNPTIQEYCGADAERTRICTQIEKARKTLWTKIELNQWNQHSPLFRVVISVQEFFIDFWKEFTSQGRFNLYVILGIALGSDDPFVLQTGVRTLTGAIERTTLGRPLEPIRVTMEHTQQHYGYSWYVFRDNQPYGGARGGKVEVTSFGRLAWSHNLDNSETLKRYVTQATGAVFVSRTEFNAWAQRSGLPV